MDLVERLRIPITWCADYNLERNAAADEIERLEAHKRAQAGDIMTLGQQVGKLEAERLRASHDRVTDQAVRYADEIERLQHYEAAYGRLRDELDTKDAEIERLQNRISDVWVEVKDRDARIDQQRAEIERLRRVVESAIAGVDWRHGCAEELDACLRDVARAMGIRVKEDD